MGEIIKYTPDELSNLPSSRDYADIVAQVGTNDDYKQSLQGISEILEGKGLIDGPESFIRRDVCAIAEAFHNTFKSIREGSTFSLSLATAMIQIGDMNSELDVLKRLKKIEKFAKTVVSASTGYQNRFSFGKNDALIDVTKTGIYAPYYKLMERTATDIPVTQDLLKQMDTTSKKLKDKIEKLPGSIKDAGKRLKIAAGNYDTTVESIGEFEQTNGQAAQAQQRLIANAVSGTHIKESAINVIDVYNDSATKGGKASGTLENLRRVYQDAGLLFSLDAQMRSSLAIQEALVHSYGAELIGHLTLPFLVAKVGAQQTSVLSSIKMYAIYEMTKNVDARTIRRIGLGPMMEQLESEVGSKSKVSARIIDAYTK